MEWLLHNWWLFFVFGGSISAGAKGVAAWNERRANRRLERYRIKQETKVAMAQAKGMGRIDAAQAKRELERVTAEHDAVDTRWFEYETDLATILDYPMMIDLREPLTVEFHTAKRRADLLRPATPEQSTGIEEYRNAVHAYAAAFDVAEQEAQRRRRGDFDPMEQERLARAQRLLAVALNGGATGAERQQAYQRARKELEGLLNLPLPATVALERQVRAALESSN
ncbi:putative protein OS=Tsukamurella paurometabola (strain ATCC 8368 / DSM / CCUG 35730 /CIP 100753 / JCM 10117 / KCTC 9821 / NBRC 16120 / NCIMB 702349/ NCTC 13040) OX=521096 GN=Tpau_3392 PE=4 SV=1 [Tsukamurella paurometabola]|uniref:Uncharacterized protein n=1 Tax=Tsukamurella paurometabola (strain ATCC 8368 / DSM 20162 / CCUG 35730 / CIP 100753 / JCM 10117 / KCTC 9821 / NBRC 16120 / NCIMB 702349 / NCTC 13040) TaxID=521096 RepID=D5UWH7_TSUPD|nr:hypothetical protein [Tsukamurella paurometabola]ADG79976.1 conserved hypothetical protein [Tsukamurella paurometabola DSM 20162]SUP37894.1 Uncharacterised protein [Tsukamurella paurometabola]